MLTRFDSELYIRNFLTLLIFLLIIKMIEVIGTETSSVTVANSLIKDNFAVLKIQLPRRLR